MRVKCFVSLVYWVRFNKMSKTKQLIAQLYSLVDDMNFGATLYAIADAGIYRELIDVLDIDNPKHRILFKDTFVQEYENVAPYLISLDRDDAFTEKIITEGYGKTWLTFVISRQDMHTLAFDLRERINIYSEKHEKEVIFRFYDPRNLERYFKMITVEEAQEFFTDINGIFAYVDSEDENKLNIYASTGKEIKLLKEDIV
ncbi:MAG TPA: DUF4123 domain-containing protein [Lutibacter sp.]|nr:DUF4123 domain-containing protein [Lutibacter sp.]